MVRLIRLVRGDVSIDTSPALTVRSLSPAWGPRMVVQGALTRMNFYVHAVPRQRLRSTSYATHGRKIRMVYASYP